MIRPVTCVCLLLAAGSGLYLYEIKHEAQLMDREIERVLKDADAARQRAGILRAEYALLNEPSRLDDLAAHHLSLAKTEPAQFTSLADLDKRLPAVPEPAVEVVPASAPEPDPEDSPVASLAHPTDNATLLADNTKLPVVLLPPSHPAAASAAPIARAVAPVPRSSVAAASVQPHANVAVPRDTGAQAGTTDAAITSAPLPPPATTKHTVAVAHVQPSAPIQRAAVSTASLTPTSLAPTSLASTGLAPAGPPSVGARPAILAARAVARVDPPVIGSALGMARMPPVSRPGGNIIGTNIIPAGMTSATVP